MPLQEPSFDASAVEETSRVQNLSSVAPPPLAEERTRDASTETTHNIPTFVPEAGERQPLRTLGWVMVIGGAVALALVLAVTKLRSAPAPQQAALAPPPPVVAAPQQAAVVQEAPPTQAEPTRATKGRRGKRAAAAPVAAAEANVTSIRIRARVAPVRAAPEADAKVVCSVKRGAVMRSFQQTPGSKARWFAVHCGKDSPGWVHENFLSVH